MSVKEIICPFWHPTCQAGCTKVQCRAHHPVKSPIIMESQKSICKSDEYHECMTYMDGVEFQERRRKEHKGCPFLTNRECGHPDRYRCDGAVPPFKIEGGNLKLLDSCLNEDYTECPNYKTGIAFRETWKKVKSIQSA